MRIATSGKSCFPLALEFLASAGRLALLPGEDNLIVGLSDLDRAKQDACQLVRSASAGRARSAGAERLGGQPQFPAQAFFDFSRAPAEHLAAAHAVYRHSPAKRWWRRCRRRLLIQSPLSGHPRDRDEQSFHLSHCPVFPSHLCVSHHNRPPSCARFYRRCKNK